MDERSVPCVVPQSRSVPAPPPYRPRTFDAGRHPGSPGGELSRRMSRVKRRDNGPELSVRRALHARGLRYRVAWPVPGQRRRTIDIAFTRLRLAVFLDGCFWHGCELHLHFPKANAEWWRRKIETNRARDVDVTAQLEALDWTVMRLWEHEDPDLVAARVHEWVVARLHREDRQRPASADGPRTAGR